LNLLFGAGTSTPAETGLKIANNGQISFVAGQVFPGTGPGTITGVTAGTDLTGGGTSGAVTVNLDTTKVPQLAAANTFTGNQTVNGNLSATGVVTGSAFNLGSALFAFGSYTNGNAFFGFAGNTTTTGGDNTAAGPSALSVNTGGAENVAVGTAALFTNSTGGSNAAVGVAALDNNTTGDNNTAEGYSALALNMTGDNNTGVGAQTGLTLDGTYITGCCNTFLGANAFASTGSLTNATALGAYAVVTENNALVLGSINGVGEATVSANVGIGTTSPQFTLDVHGGMLHVGGNVPQIRSAEGAYLDWNALTGTTGETDFVNNQGKGIGGFAFMNTPPGGTPVSTLMFISAAGKVGIGTTAPDSLLSVNGSADKAGGGSWGTFSDARLKTLHGNFTAGLSQIMKLHPVRYRYKEQNAMNIRDRDEHVGFVAQEVQRVIPEAVTTNSRGYLLVNNDPILWTMLNAIQQQQAEILALRAQSRQPPVVAKIDARPGRPRETATAEAGSDRGEELRRVRAELERLRKKDAGLESRLARLEQALAGLQAPAPTLVSGDASASQPEK
jgi:trimeric autotransporter adhesin